MKPKIPLSLTALAFMASVAALSGVKGIERFSSKPKDPKNKYNLTPEEVILLESMTPKEKKKFLKGILK
jgi:hypothetical protein